jgi:hypothetical protein
MKRILQLSFILASFALLVSACNLGKTVTVRDTVKEVIATTADYYDFYLPGVGQGTIKDYKGIISDNWENKDLLIDIVPAVDKTDAGYFVIKPASGLHSDTALAPTSGDGMLSIPVGQLKVSMSKRRGN